MRTCIYTEAAHCVLLKDLLYDTENAIFERESAGDPE